MNSYTLQLHLSSAEDLKDVKTFGRMHAYAVAWIDPHRKEKTSPDRGGGTHPSWNQQLELPLADRPQDFGKPGQLVVRILCHGLLREKLVGTVTVPLKVIDVIRAGLKPGSVDLPHPFSYQVKRPSGRFQGILDFSVRFVPRDHEHSPSPIPSAPPLTHTSVIHLPTSASPIQPLTGESIIYRPVPAPLIYPPVSAAFGDENQANDDFIYCQVQIHPLQAYGVSQDYSLPPMYGIYKPHIATS